MPAPSERGSFIELTAGGTRPLRPGRRHRATFLQDGDEITISGRVAATPGRPELGLGEVRGRIVGG